MGLPTPATCSGSKHGSRGEGLGFGGLGFSRVSGLGLGGGFRELEGLGFGGLGFSRVSGLGLGGGGGLQRVSRAFAFLGLRAEKV